MGSDGVQSPLFLVDKLWLNYHRPAGFRTQDLVPANPSAYPLDHPAEAVIKILSRLFARNKAAYVHMTVAENWITE